MASNQHFMPYDMEQRVMDWSQTTQNERFQSQNHGMSAVTNLPQSVTARAPYTATDQMTYTRSAGHNFSQINSGVWPPSQLHQQTIHLLCEVRKEVLSQVYNNSTPQLSPQFDIQFEKRRELQQFLANRCTDPTLFRYVTSLEFLVKPDTQKFFEVVERLTGLDVTKFKKTQSGTSDPARPHQVQLNQTVAQGKPYIDFLQNQIAPNYNQFQVHGSVTSVNNGGGMSHNPMNRLTTSADTMAYQSLVPINTYSPDTIQHISGSLQFQDIGRVSGANKKTRTWYKMPTEQYVSGRVVEQTDNNCQSAQVPLQTVANFHEPWQQQREGTCMTDSGMPWNRSLDKSDNVANHFANERAEIVPSAEVQCTGSQQSVPNARNNVEFPVLKNSTVSTVEMCTDQSGSGNASSSHDDQSFSQHVQIKPRSTLVGDVSQSANQTKKLCEPLQPENRMTLMVQKNTVCPIESSPLPVLCEDETVSKAVSNHQESECSKLVPEDVSHGDSRTESLQNKTNHQENECSKLVPEVVSHSDSQTESLQKNKTTSAEATGTHKSLGEYDPPLPVIIHKKREDRISPRKIFQNTIKAKIEESSQSHSSGSKPLEKRKQSDHGQKHKESREPLFAVLGSLFTKRSEHLEGKKSSTVSRHPEKHKHMSHQRNKDHKHWSVSNSKEKQTDLDKEKCRRKSAEVSSSSSSKHHNDSEEYRKPSQKSSEKRNKYHSKNSKTEKRDQSRSKEQSEKSYNMDKCIGDKGAKQSSDQTVREKEYSKLSGKYKENEKDSNKLKLHRRGKSLPHRKEVETRPSKGNRSQTWNGSKISIDNLKNTAEEVKETMEKSTELTIPNQKFVWLHGHKLLLIAIPEGQYVVTKEMIATCLSDHNSTEVYRCKTSELDINNKTLTHSCRKDVQKYLSIMKIDHPSQIDIISLLNAQRLFHCLKGITSCDQKTCIGMQQQSVPSLVLPPIAEKKDRSASPDSTMHSETQSTVKDASKGHSTENTFENDLQQNKVSSQSSDDVEDPSLSDDQEDSSSSVSDATDIYCDGKPVPLQSLSENIDDDSDFVSKIKSHIELDGGLAVFRKENSVDKYLRFVVVRGNKCFLYQDLFQLFGQSEVVKVVVNNSMQVKTCTLEEAEYFNRNQPHLSFVDPDDNSFIHEKYARKVFAYFGEIFPKLKLPIEADLDSIKSPLAQNIEKPGRKRKYDEISDDHCPDNPVDDDDLRESKQHTMQVFSKLKSQHLDMAAEIAALKAELQKTKKTNSCLVKKYKTYEADLTVVKSELKETISVNTDLEQKYRKQEDTLSHLKANLEVKEEENLSLQKERDHCLDFIERITDAYKVADDVGEEMCMYDDNQEF